MFEAGKTYRMRNGELAFIVDVLSGPLEYPVRGRVAFTGVMHSWAQTGHWDLSTADQRDLLPGPVEFDPTLLERRVADLEIQVKELIRSRDGSHVVR